MEPTSWIWCSIWGESSKYRLHHPEFQGGKVFTPGVKSLSVRGSRDRCQPFSLLRRVDILSDL